MKPDMRICRTHPDEAVNEHAQTDCELFSLKWSADRTALLVITECGCDQGYDREFGEPCEACDTEGWQYAAETMKQHTADEIAVMLGGEPQAVEPSMVGGGMVAVVPL